MPLTLKNGAQEGILAILFAYLCRPCNVLAVVYKMY